MTLIDDSGELAALCRRLSHAAFVTVDTEFMRESTFWPRLCVVQLAGPDEAVAVDAMADGIDLEPLFGLLANPGPLKVFHAARQDIEIFHHATGRVPAPLFDTQVAAMVCGFGDAASYERLASKLAGARVDKSQRFTDWSRRPLSRRQIQYALSDVTHLRVVYEKLARRLEETGRTGWLDEEMAILTDSATYEASPEDAWRRLKVRKSEPRFLGVLREVAAWRELRAQSRDVPRNRVVRDEVMMQIAAHAPQTQAELVGIRGLSKGLATGKAGPELLAAVRRGLELREEDLPRLDMVKPPSDIGPLVELLKVLLKMKCEAQNVAQKLVATTAVLELIAADDEAPVPALRGWRREIFGNDALALKRGELALAARGRKTTLVPLGKSRAAD